MDTSTTFDSTVESMNDLLNYLQVGQTQLPEFQRSWIWDDERIRKLLVSISMSYPIGVVTFLQTGSDGMVFKQRPIHGVELTNDMMPERLILDGQQRLTSLYLPLFTDGPVETTDGRNREDKRYYYIDIEKILDDDIDSEDAIISVNENKQIRAAGNVVVADYSTVEKECAAGVFPINLIFNTEKMFHWMNMYCNHTDPDTQQKRQKLWMKFTSEIVTRFQNYQIPIIMLRKYVPKEAVCQVFENVNTGGISLSVFELLTASFAAENYSLRDAWDYVEASANQEPVLSGLANTDFLQTVALLVSYQRKKQAPNAAVSCKRKDILKLSVGEFKGKLDLALEGYLNVSQFLQEQKIFLSRDLPYSTQLVPLAAIFSELGRRAHNHTVRSMIARWLWCGILGEQYGSAVETRFAKDLVEVLSWIDGGPEPTTVKEADFSPDRLLTLRTRNSAAYKGINALLMRDGGKDFLSGVDIDISTYRGNNFDIHHIFPRHYCHQAGIDHERCDSIVNKTPLSYTTNRIIGGNAPSIYLDKLQTEHNINPTSLDNILSTHVIDINATRSDDFETFFDKRKDALLSRIMKAIS